MLASQLFGCLAFFCKKVIAMYNSSYADWKTLSLLSRLSIAGPKPG